MKKKKRKKKTTSEKNDLKKFGVTCSTEGKTESLLKHVSETTSESVKSTEGLLEENMPNIYDNFRIVHSYALKLEKIVKKIHHCIDEEGHINLECAMCPLHCFKLSKLPGNSGRPNKKALPKIM